MPLYYYVYLIIISFIIIFLAFSFPWQKKNIPAQLFARALKDENSGHYEEAIIIYQIALAEIKKTRFHRTMEIKIVEKLKVLHLLIEYRDSFHLNR